MKGLFSVEGSHVSEVEPVGDTVSRVAEESLRRLERFRCIQAQPEREHLLRRIR